MRHTRLSLKLSVPLLCFSLIAFSGCKNGNLFGGLHHRGDSSNPTYLLSDATAAMNDTNYAQALSLYERVLAQDPNNSEALYGAARAAIANSGLNFGTILANVIHQTSAITISGLGDFVAKSRESVRASAVSNNNSLLAGIYLPSLNLVIDKAICRLNKIVSGNADGSISPNSIDVLMNLAALRIIRAVSKPLDLGLLDIENNSGTYSVTSKLALTGGVCDGSQQLTGFTQATQEAMIRQIIIDVASAYACLNKAAVILGLSNDKIIVKLRSDVYDAAVDFYTGGKVPSQCVDEFNLAGIHNATELTNYQGVFTNPPSGC